MFPRLSKIDHNNKKNQILLSSNSIQQYNLIRYHDDSESPIKLFNESLPCLFIVNNNHDDHQFELMLELMESEWKYYNMEYMYIGLFVMNHQCVLLRRMNVAFFGNVHNFLSREFNLNIQENLNQLFSEIVKACQENDQAIDKGNDIGLFNYYSREFSCLFRECEENDFSPFNCLKDGISQLEELKELFESDNLSKNHIKLILGKRPFFVLPHQREQDWNIEIQFQYYVENTLQFHSCIVKSKECYKKAWENFFDIQSLQYGIPLSDFPPNYIETCDKAITELISKFKVTEWGIICDINSFLKFNTKEDAEEHVKNLFSDTLSEFIPNPPEGDARFHMAIKLNNHIEIDPFHPCEQMHGGIIVNVNDELILLGVVLKQIVEEKWKKFLMESFGKKKEILMEKEVIERFYAERRDLSLEECLEYIFEREVKFDKESVSCFGKERLTISFIGEWNGKEAFFKLSMQRFAKSEILTNLANNSKLRITHPNISQIYHYETIENTEKIEYFLDAVAKLRNDIGENHVDVLSSVKKLDISIQECLMSITEIVKFTKRNSNSQLCKHIIGQCISILKQLDNLDILHQDIALDNIMIRKCENLFELVLIDFDFSEKYSKGNENEIRKSIHLSGDITKHPYWCEKKKTSIGDIYSMSIVIFEIIYYACFGIDFVGKYFNDLKNSGRFRIELVKYMKSEIALKELKEFIGGKKEFEWFKQLMEYMLHYEENPKLSTIIEMVYHYNSV